MISPHVTTLAAIAARLVGHADANDVVQEALLRAWRRWSTFDPGRGTVRAWLAAIVVDRARQHRRGLTRRGAVPAVDLSDEPARDPDHAQRLVIEAAVRGLPRRQREAVVLFYLADLSVEETAKVLRMQSGTVKAHLAAARAALKNAMESP